MRSIEGVRPAVLEYMLSKVQGERGSEVERGSDKNEVTRVETTTTRDLLHHDKAIRRNHACVLRVQ
jgi:hypothetical protein